MYMYTSFLYIKYTTSIVIYMHLITLFGVMNNFKVKNLS